MVATHTAGHAGFIRRLEPLRIPSKKFNCVIDRDVRCGIISGSLVGALARIARIVGGISFPEGGRRM